MTTTGREGSRNWGERDGKWERWVWELGEKGVGTGRERGGGGNWERIGWELREKGVGTGKEGGGN